MSKRLLITVVTFVAAASAAQDASHCGDEGVWLQILGSGGADLTDQRSAASYLVWNGERARVMIDTGSGAALRFDEAGADFKDLAAIVFTRLQAYNTADFPSLVEGSHRSDRERVLPVFGPAIPDGESTTAFIGRLIGPNGAYGYLSRFLTVDSPAEYRISVRDVLASGTRRWADFGTEDVRLSAIPVYHGGLPALAWRVEIDDVSLVFAGGFSGRKGTVAKFAENADALVVHHAVSVSARGKILDLYSKPSDLGRIATEAKARSLILGHRTTRTLGMETVNTGAIEDQYRGPVYFADDLQCWGW